MKKMKKTKMNKYILPRIKELDKFLSVLEVQSIAGQENAMVGEIISHLVRMKDVVFEIDIYGNIIAQKGEGMMPCVCSHLDTVHSVVNGYEVIYKDNIVYSPSGIGGDDKCGIITALIALERRQKVKAIFFSSEEVGLIGSSSIDDSYFSNISFLIGVDRKGNSDFICMDGSDYTVSNQLIADTSGTLERHGYSPCTGLITDSIGLWRDGIGISAVNVSCGYYNAHTNSEYINLDDLNRCIYFVLDLIADTEYSEMQYESFPSNYDKFNSVDESEGDELDKYIAVVRTMASDYLVSETEMFNMIENGEVDEAEILYYSSYMI